jgi:hypothetical protein
MKRMLIVCALAALPIYGQEVIAQDSNGLVVEVKEKYGGLLLDTATVVMLHQGQFVLVKKEGGTGWYPSSFHSVRVLEKLAPAEHLASSKRKEEKDLAVD